MKATRKKVDKIAAALIAASRRPEEAPFPPDWRQELMESIRSGGRPSLQWALGQLSPDDRMVLTLTYLNKYTATEAAELLGWSLPRVKLQSYRARRKLRAIISEILPR